MLTCMWARALTKYDCREVRGLDGAVGLEIGTPFSLPGGSAINLYIMPIGDHVLISDNGDTLMHLSGMGIDVWNSARMKGLREVVGIHNLSLSEAGDFKMISTQENAAYSFARAITGLLAINNWAYAQMRIEVREHDLPAEAEPYIIARNPSARFVIHPKIRGASKSEHVFDFLHGNDLIDVIAPHAVSTGMVMRKVGDILNGPFVEGFEPLIIVDDRFDPIRAESEMGMLASSMRTQSFSSLTRTFH